MILGLSQSDGVLALVMYLSAIGIGLWIAYMVVRLGVSHGMQDANKKRPAVRASRAESDAAEALARMQ